MLNLVGVDWWELVKSALVCLALIVLGVLWFKLLWVDQMVFELPRGHYRINNDFKDSMKISNLSEYISVMWTILTDLDIPYWLDFVGLEGSLVS